MKYAVILMLLIFSANQVFADPAEVFFIEPKDGAVVGSPVEIKMGVRGIDVVKAGDLTAGTGHHHLIINKGPIKMGQPVPADKQHIHYGGGQTEDSVELEPGDYTLTLQFADGMHKSYGKKLSSSIKITVK